MRLYNRPAVAWAHVSVRRSGAKRELGPKCSCALFQWPPAQSRSTNGFAGRSTASERRRHLDPELAGNRCKCVVDAGHEAHQLPSEVAELERHVGHVDALRAALQSLATADEFLGGHQTALVGVDELEQGPSVGGIKLERVEVGAELLVLQRILEVPEGDHPSALDVNRREKRRQIFDVYLAALDDRRCDELRVALRRLDGAAAENGGHRVQHSKVDHAYVQHENGQKQEARILQGLHCLPPTDAPGDGLKEGEHRAIH
mmetsp:Transcript_94577/g.272332  ORF Transcript_94577/g.272332 Transcript_94577/m.272332 type:complete len:259 (+) Transcript_94577:131-907(+)